ncbi:unnamed protein product [Candida verbasci]|uniref:Zn(2)-C6 fungal-type domain-containing protein n=1 Tax=Candida verbasci TaxID=1227364 RepID=A0A9W4XBN6_9ASCO|nr:unnamed protein product [Candida verbasci]
MARSKHTRPCDSCAVRKIKCDFENPCSNCQKHNLTCTNDRKRKKSGPKNIKEKTRTTIYNLQTKIPLEISLQCLRLYEAWYYGIWPVVSVDELIKNDSYSLICAISSVVVGQSLFISKPLIPPQIMKIDFLNESLKNRSMEPSTESVLTSFFLHIAFGLKGTQPVGICYLREAITLAQIIGLHKPETYAFIDRKEQHRLRKLYYLLLVSERFMCIEISMPVILEPTIPLPSLDDEEYSVLLNGFRQLVKVFAIPNKSFFNNFNDIQSSQLIITVQRQLDSIGISEVAPDIQKTNIILSKYWMKSLTWNIAKNNNLLELDGCLSIKYPFEIAQSFLKYDLPILSFEFNGPGVSLKLLCIATALIDSIKLSQDPSGYEYVQKLFNIVKQLKNDITVPVKDYVEVEEALNNLDLVQSLFIYSPSTILS